MRTVLDSGQCYVFVSWVKEGLDKWDRFLDSVLPGVFGKESNEGEQ